MFSERLKAARKARGLTLDELAELYNRHFEGNISKGTLSKYENGKQIPVVSTAKRLSSVLGISADALFGSGGDTPVRIPVYGKVAAGIPIDAIEDILDYEEISADMARDGDFIALKVKGDSMEPKISSGDVVIIRCQPDVESGEVAVVLVDGENATVKKLVKQKNGIVLYPTNPSYEPMYFSNREIAELPVTVIGKVVELRAKF